MKVKKLYQILSRKPKKPVAKDKVLREKTLCVYPVQDSIAKIKSNFEVQESGCWFWLGTLDKYGYGQIKVGKKTFKAHRYSYEIHYGSFDKTLHVCHHCDQPSCVNPKHLFLGTAKDNAIDRANKGRQKESSKRLTMEKELEIIQTLQTGLSQQKTALQHNVHSRTVGRVLARHQLRLADVVNVAENAILSGSKP